MVASQGQKDILRIGNYSATMYIVEVTFISNTPLANERFCCPIAGFSTAHFLPSWVGNLILAGGKSTLYYNKMFIFFCLKNRFDFLKWKYFCNYLLFYCLWTINIHWVRKLIILILKVKENAEAWISQQACLNKTKLCLYHNKIELDHHWLALLFLRTILFACLS